MIRFALEPIYGSSMVAVLCAVLVVAVIVLVTPPTQNPVHRRVLILLRCIAALWLLLAAFRPALIRTDKLPAEAVLIVAADTSRSMTLTDGDGSDRWTTQKKVWQKLITGVRGMKALDVQLLVYDRDARPVSNAEPGALDAFEPAGDLTDLGVATSQAIQAAAGQPIAGVVLIGDGTQTAPLSKSGGNATQSSAQRSVETLNALGVPFWPVPIGPAAGAQASRDAAVDALDESFQLFAGNEFNVSFQLSARGLAGIEVPVELIWIKPDGTRIEAAERAFVPQRSVDESSFNVSMVAPEPGAYRLEVTAATQSGELVTVNNTQSAFVQVRAGGGRILYLEGDHRQEQIFVARALRRFPDLDLTFRSLRSDLRWPVDMGNWFAPGKFDVYVIGDVDSDAIGQEQLAKLADRVSEGAGLVMLGGYHTYSAGGYASSPLADAIPIRMSPTAKRAPRGGDAATGELPAGQLPGPVVIEVSRQHSITDLGEDNTELWKTLPPQKGANRFLDPKVAPGVQVLLQTPQKEPLMVVGEFGRSRTAALAFDSTWQWWRSGNSEVHRRFWRQLMLWMLSREESGENKVVVSMDSRRFALENPPEFLARIESFGDQSEAVDLVAEVIDAKGVATPITATSQIPATENTTSIKGRLPKLSGGFFTLRVRPSDPNSTTDPGEMAFQAIDASREMSRPMADPVYLTQLANLTADHGGAAFAPDEVGELIRTIEKRRRQADIPIVKKHRLGDGPVSGWIVFGIFAIALTIEWFFRRRWGLA